MIQHPDLHQPQRVYQPPGDGMVGLAGFGHTGRMVVGENHRGRIMLHGPAHHLPGVHRRRINGALKQLLEGNQPVLVVQKQTGKHLIGQSAQASSEQLPGLVGIIQWQSPLQRFSQITAPQLQCRQQQGPPGGAHARQPGHTLRPGIQQGPQPATRRQLGSGQVHRRHALLPGTQKNCQQLRITQRYRPARQQLFPWPFSRGPVSDCHAVSFPRNALIFHIIVKWAALIP